MSLPRQEARGRKAGNQRGEVWVITAAFNEAPVIRTVLLELRDGGYSVVVVDDGSTDATASVIEPLDVHIVTHPVNLGQGAALRSGIEYALRNGARYLVTFDADGQHRAEDIPKLVEKVASGEWDVALGTRFSGGGVAAGIPALRRRLLRLALAYTRLTTGLVLTDTHNGLRAFSAEAARKLTITQNRMGHASQILSQIAAHRLRYVEVPVTVIYTEYALSKGQKLDRVFDVLWESWTERLRP